MFLHAKVDLKKNEFILYTSFQKLNLLLWFFSNLLLTFFSIFFDIIFSFCMPFLYIHLFLDHFVNFIYLYRICSFSVICLFKPFVNVTTQVFINNLWFFGLSYFRASTYFTLKLLVIYTAELFLVPFYV